MKIRSLLLALAAALVVLGTSCGVEASDKAADKADQTTAPAGDDTADSEAAPAEPSAEENDDDAAPVTEPADDEEAAPATTEPADEGDSGDGGSGDEEIVPGFSREDIVTQLEGSGLTTDQAECVADALIDAGLTDMSDPTSFDPSSEEYQSYIAAVQACVLGG